MTNNARSGYAVSLIRVRVVEAEAHVVDRAEWNMCSMRNGLQDNAPLAIYLRDRR